MPAGGTGRPCDFRITDISYLEWSVGLPGGKEMGLSLRLEGVGIMAEIEAWQVVTLGIAMLGLIAGLYAFTIQLWSALGKHVADKDIHMPGAGLQSVKTCDAEMKAVSDKVTANEQRAEKGLAELKGDILREIGEVKSLIRMNHNGSGRKGKR